MNGYPLDHIGIAVANLEEEIALQQKLFGFELDTREVVESQKVELVFLKLPNTKLELLTPTSPESPLQKFLEKRGPGIHHLCYEVPDIVAELATLKEKGVKLIDEVPRPGAHHTQIAFLHPKSTGGTLIELCQYPKN